MDQFETEEHQLPPDEKPRWLDDSANVKKVIRWFFFSCGVMLALDLIFIFHLQHKHTYFPELENIPGFYCFYGCGACVLLVLVAKQLRKILMRPEDYYERNEGSDSRVSDRNRKGEKNV